MGVARLYRVGSPYNGVELDDIDFEQTADVMYMAHIDHPPTKLVRHAHDDWEFVTVAFGPVVSSPTGLSVTPDTPNTDADNSGNAYFPQPASYVVTAIVDDTEQESRPSAAASATNDLTLKRNYNAISWTAVAGADRYRIYKSNNTQDYGYIGTTDSTSFVDDNIGPALDNGPPVGNNPFAAAGDYPCSVTLFEQRLILGYTANNPNAIFMSRSADFENFDISRPLRDDDAITIGVVAGRVNSINQLVSTTTLLALTSDAIFKVDGATDGGYLTATQTRARRQIGRGSDRLGPLIVDNVVFYRPNEGSSVRSIGYSFEQDGFTAPDVSIYSPHFFRNFGIKSWAYLQEPDALIVAVRSDGRLLCFTFEQEQQVSGWTLWETDGRVESVCAITENGEDRLYLTVWRTIGGVDKLYIERLASSLWSDFRSSCYLDCATSFAVDEPRTDFTGLAYLEGRSVDVLADGAIIRDLVVADGKISLPDAFGPASQVTVGLRYTSLVETLPLIIAGGATAGRRQQVGEAVLELIDSMDVYAGPSIDKLYRVKSRSDEAYGDPDTLMNGFYRFDNENHVSEQITVVIKHDAPGPFHLTGAFLDPVISG
ncbi:hypothetical protein [Sphingomonas asaccharolytica]|uniref:hypothetical protein n=1 Tax=Sphingomonas asaccharolytica TaxID=40681 RepID=UPI0008377DA0|nr:hypothetical protein [Sphingomonas asaccharolytica]